MLLNPIVEYENISKWATTLVGKQITPHSLVKRLGIHLNKHHPVTVSFFRVNDTVLSPGDFTIGAEYDPNLDEEKRKQFRISLIINHPKQSPWHITTEIVDRLVIDLVEALVHEYRHQHQYRSRKYIMNKIYVSKHSNVNVKEDQEYLGMPDEVDAYAANIAARFFILEYKLNTIESMDLEQYLGTFGHAHPVVRKLLKKVAKNLSYLRECNNGKDRRTRSKRKPSRTR